MKKVLIVVAACMLSCAAFAAQDMIVLVADNATTGTTADVVSSGSVWGCVDRIYLVPMDATNALTVTVSLTATDNYTGEVRDLLTEAGYTNTATLSVAPRIANVTTANAAMTYAFSKIRLHDDVVKLNVKSASATNRTVKAFVYYDRD